MIEVCFLFFLLQILDSKQIANDFLKSNSFDKCKMITQEQYLDEVELLSDKTFPLDFVDELWRIYLNALDEYTKAQVSFFKIKHIDFFRN